MTFAALLVTQKREKRKAILCFFSFRVLFACPKRTKRTKRGMLSSFEHLLSPRGDRCEHTSPTVRQLLNHGYRFETLKRRLGFAAVPCQAMANLAVQVWVRKLGSSCADGMKSAFLLFLLAIFGFFLVGELTHMGACVLASLRQGTA